jgi:hypothetical protein
LEIQESFDFETFDFTIPVDIVVSPRPPEPARGKSVSYLASQPDDAPLGIFSMNASTA